MALDNLYFKCGESGIRIKHDYEEFKNESEKRFFEVRLARNDGNIKRTAEELGMQRSHLYKKLDRYGLR